MDEKFTSIDCPNCGVIFAINKKYEKRRRGDQKNFLCPNGHTICFPEGNKPDVNKLQTKLKAIRAENSKLKTKNVRLLAEIDQLQASLQQKAR